MSGLVPHSKLEASRILFRIERAVRDDPKRENWPVRTTLEEELERVIHETLRAAERVARADPEIAEAIRSLGRRA